MSDDPKDMKRMQPYGCLYMDSGERWPKVREQIDGLSQMGSELPLLFDIQCSLVDQDEAIEIAQRLIAYAKEKRMAAEPPSINVRMPDGKTRSLPRMQVEVGDGSTPMEIQRKLRDADESS